jgi:Ca2+/Na+ antiporter
VVPVGTLIDWWIITRETVFILLYLIVLSIFLYGNKVEMYKALVLLVLYVAHIFLMKFSSKYEVAIKQALANKLEIKTLSKIAKQDITRFHMNLKTEAISIEMLNKVHFTLRGEYIVFKDSLIRKKLKLSNSIKSGEEKYADKSDKTLMARKMWKEAVSMIIIKLQAYRHNLQIQRTQQCKQRLDKMLPMLECKELEDDNKIFGESYDSEEDSVVSVSDQESVINVH